MTLNIGSGVSHERPDIRRPARPPPPGDPEGREDEPVSDKTG